MGGDDTVHLGGRLTQVDAIDGGAGNDIAVLDGDYSVGLTLGAGTLTSVETLRFTHIASEAVYSYRLTTNDGNVAAGATLAVDGSGLPVGGTLNFSDTAGYQAGPTT